VYEKHKYTQIGLPHTVNYERSLVKHRKFENFPCSGQLQFDFSFSQWIIL